MAKISTELDNANTASEPTSRSKKVKKTYSKRGKLHGPGKINKESEGDDMEGSGADNNEEEAEKSSGILAGGDQRDHDNDRNRSSLELGQHGDEEKVTEETDTVAAADKSEYEVEEEKGEAPLTNGGTSSTSAATTTGAASTANGTYVDTSQAANISADQQPSPSLPKLKRKRGRPSGSSKKSTHFSKKVKRTSVADTGATEQYRVKTILAVRIMRFNGGDPEKGLLVHWEDFDKVKDLSWEPERILREDALQIVEQFYRDWTGEEEFR